MTGPHIAICFHRGRIVHASFHSSESAATRAAGQAVTRTCSGSATWRVYDLLKLLRHAEAAEEQEVAELERMME